MPSSTTRLTVLIGVVAGGVWLATVTMGAAQQKMTNYQLVILKPGPAHATAATPGGQKLVEEHVAHLHKLGAERRSMAAGPVTGGAGGIAGMIIMKAGSAEQARDLAAADPAVKTGIFTVDVMPFLALDAGMRPWAAFPDRETVYFGFLNSGPNRGQEPETAKRLQAEHLAYMGDQHKQGKLVFAGPFVDGGIHRGLVVYRAASLEEARTRAEADPMVKAGRLAIDLHAWQVPKGALP